MLNLCIPYNAIERISTKLSSNTWISYARRQSSQEHVEQISRTLRGSLVEVRVRLATSRIKTGELIRLRVGDIITTKKDIHTPLLVMVEGVPKFKAFPGAYKGHKAIRIESIITDPIEAIGD
jgi:flagellar motor switch protein FliM